MPRARRLLEAHAVAHAAGEREEAGRALGNLGYVLMTWVEPEPAWRYAVEALSYAREHEVQNLVSYIEMMLAWLRLRRGEWAAAERAARGELERGTTVAQLLAKIVITELAVRRGDADAVARLADLAEHADRAGDLQRLTPVLELRIEWALTRGGPMPLERFDRLVEKYGPRGGMSGWGGARVAAWAAVAGYDMAGDDRSPVFAAMARRDWAAAADGFGEVGWSYDRALMLSLLDDEASLAEAIDIARGLGAEPLVRRVAKRMRDLGLSVPRGPRDSTRSNPAGLTSRQLEVLALSGERARERRDRRPPRRLAADGRAPRRRRARQARCRQPLGGGQAGIRARPHALVRSQRRTATVSSQAAGIVTGPLLRPVYASTSATRSAWSACSPSGPTASNALNVGP